MQKSETELNYKVLCHFGHRKKTLSIIHYQVEKQKKNLSSI